MSVRAALNKMASVFRDHCVGGHAAEEVGKAQEHQEASLYQNVASFDVTVHHVIGMQVTEAHHCLLGINSAYAFAERPKLCQQRIDAAAGHIFLENADGIASTLHPQVVHDVGVPQLPQETDLVLQRCDLQEKLKPCSVKPGCFLCSRREYGSPLPHPKDSEGPWSETEACCLLSACA